MESTEPTKTETETDLPEASILGSTIEEKNVETATNLIADVTEDVIDIEKIAETNAYDETADKVTAEALTERMIEEPVEAQTHLEATEEIAEEIAVASTEDTITADAVTQIETISAEGINTAIEPEEASKAIALTNSPIDEMNSSEATLAKPIPKVIPIHDSRAGFKIATFKQAFADNLFQLYKKSLQTATVQECYQVLVQMVRDRLLLNHSETGENTTQIVAELSLNFTSPAQLETNLMNLDIVAPVRQGLQELGIDLSKLYAQEDNLDSEREDLQGYFDALTTAKISAIGYGIYEDGDTSSTGDSNLWSVECAEAKVEVRFGGHIEAYTDGQGRFQVRWMPQETIIGIPHDLPVSSYGGGHVNLLRQWQPVLDDYSSWLNQAHPEASSLRQCFFRVSCAIQDVIRLHLQMDDSIETIPERFALHLNDTASALAIAELMYWLIDEYGLAWNQAWSITQKAFSCTLYNWIPDVISPRWSINTFSHLLPRHLEIIYEINRRFLKQVETNYPNDIERIRRMSLIDEMNNRVFRASHLVCMGSYVIDQVSTGDTCSTSPLLLSDFKEMYPGKSTNRPSSINLRRFLLQSNPRLAGLISQWIGEDWITQPQLRNLETLVNNVEFCSNWWQIKREIKQELIDYLHQQTGVEINLTSLFDVQAVPIQINQRQLLNLLHIITLYMRIKANSSTDTILRFAHRSVPRTCIFVGQALANDLIADSISKLIQAVAMTVNNDPDVQGRLQVVFLQSNRFQVTRHFYGAADLLECLPLADQSIADQSISNATWKFALNGAITIGTLNPVNVELQQAVGVKNCFLFGRNTAEVNHLRLRGYDPLQYYSVNSDLQQAINLIASGYFSSGDTDVFKALGNWLFTQDPTCVLADYQSYMECQERVSQSYQDQKQWTWMSILTTARMDQFSFDRMILEYRDIWRINPTPALTR